MFYYYFRGFNWISTIYGLKKPFPSSSERYSKVTLINKLWSLIIIVLISASYVLSVMQNAFNLETISTTNDCIISIMIILINLTIGENVCVKLYETVNKILRGLKISNRTLKLISMKLHIWLSMPSLMLLIFITLEILSSHPPFYVLIIRMPVFLTFLHLILHLCLFLAILKVINRKMFKMLNVDRKSNLILENPKATKYLFATDIKFIEDNEYEYFDLKFLCRVYDDMSTCVQLLEKLHGFQVLLIIWLMFSSAIFGVTLIACNQADLPWLVTVTISLLLIWSLIGSYVDDQLRQEVEQTEMLIVKYLIDIRCDQARRNILQTFKQLVSTNRLQFCASGLFHLNYSMTLGTIMNVITYSIIFIQLLVKD